MSQARQDDELPPLPEGLTGLRGIELVRAAYEATRAVQEPPRTARKPGTIRPDADMSWTPHRAAETFPTVTPGHWSDGTPIPDEDPPEDYL